MFAHPGFFNLWVIRIVFFPGIIGLIIFAVHLRRKENRAKLITEEQTVFEKRREREMRDIIAVNPDFKTLCYECQHFDQMRKSCVLEIVNRQATRIKLSDRHKSEVLNRYCLYWESFKEENEEKPGSTEEYL
jgi:hypothetical protein